MQYQLEVEDKDAYLASTHYIDWQNPMILAKAEELFADCGTELEKIKAAFTFVRDVIPHSGDIQSHKITHDGYLTKIGDKGSENLRNMQILVESL